MHYIYLKQTGITYILYEIIPWNLFKYMILYRCISGINAD